VVVNNALDSVELVLKDIRRLQMWGIVLFVVVMITLYFVGTRIGELEDDLHRLHFDMAKLAARKDAFRVQLHEFSVRILELEAVEKSRQKGDKDE
jgi:hypothetical protein